MVVLLFLLTVLGFVAADRILRLKKAAAASRPVREPAMPFASQAAQELPGGLFVHSGHT